MLLHPRRETCATLVEQINANNPFEPTFTVVCDENQVADKINLPHEDYPLRVADTWWVLSMMVQNYQIAYQDQGNCTAADARQLHNVMFPGEWFAGRWRERDCHPAGQPLDTYVPPFTIPQYMDVLLPIDPTDFIGNSHDEIIQSVVDWYKAFQTVHPFEDGNGRVGGVIAAWLVFIRCGIWIAPHQ